MDSRMLTDWLYQGKYEEPVAKPVFVCDSCDMEIFEGEYYYEIETNLICEDCINDYRHIAEIQGS